MFQYAKQILTLSLLAGLTASTAPAYAQTFRLLADRPQHLDKVIDGQTLFLEMDRQSSYCCELNSSAIGIEAIGGSRTYFSADRSRPTSAIPPQGFRSFSSGPAARQCFFSHDGAFGHDAWINLAATSSDDGLQEASNVEALCSDTTLRGGYNTFATPIAFLEIVSNGTLPFDAKIELTAVNSVNLGSAKRSIALSSRIDVNIHEMVGPNAIGTLTLQHNVAPGGLQAKLVSYKIDPRDGSLLPVRSEELSTRSGK